MAVEYAEIKELFDKHAPNVTAHRLEGKGLAIDSNAVTLLITQGVIAAFPFLWKLFLVWLDRHTSGRVKIKYKSSTGHEVEYEYNSLSASQVKEIVAAFEAEANPAAPTRPAEDSVIAITFVDSTQITADKIG